VGDRARAEQLLKQCRQILGQVDHPMFMPALHTLGSDARFRGQPEEARLYYCKGLEIANHYQYKLFITIMESEIAHLDRENGDYQAARDAYGKVIWVWKDFGQYAAVAHLLECFAYIALGENKLGRAARLLGAAEGLRQAIHIPLLRDEIKEYELMVARLRSQMDAADLDSAWAAGRTMNLESAARYAAAAW
jgi:hypothetical protein